MVKSTVGIRCLRNTGFRQDLQMRKWQTGSPALGLLGYCTRGSLWQSQCETCSVYTNICLNHVETYLSFRFMSKTVLSPWVLPSGWAWLFLFMLVRLFMRRSIYSGSMNELYAVINRPLFVWSIECLCWIWDVWFSWRWGSLKSRTSSPSVATTSGLMLCLSTKGMPCTALFSGVSLRSSVYCISVIKN